MTDRTGHFKLACPPVGTYLGNPWKLPESLLTPIRIVDIV